MTFAEKNNGRVDRFTFCIANGGCGNCINDTLRAKRHTGKFFYSVGITITLIFVRIPFVARSVQPLLKGFALAFVRGIGKYGSAVLCGGVFFRISGWVASRKNQIIILKTA